MSKQSPDRLEQLGYVYSKTDQLYHLWQENSDRELARLTPEAKQAILDYALWENARERHQAVMNFYVQYKSERIAHTLSTHPKDWKSELDHFEEYYHKWLADNQTETFNEWNKGGSQLEANYEPKQENSNDN